MKQIIGVTAIGTAFSALASLAQPASASGASTASAAATAAAASSAAAPESSRKPAKICLNIIPDTGTRMSRRACRTQQEWEDQGVELTRRK